MGSRSPGRPGDGVHVSAVRTPFAGAYVGGLEGSKKQQIQPQGGLAHAAQSEREWAQLASATTSRRGTLAPLRQVAVGTTRTLPFTP